MSLYWCLWSAEWGGNICFKFLFSTLCIRRKESKRLKQATVRKKIEQSALSKRLMAARLMLMATRPMQMATRPMLMATRRMIAEVQIKTNDARENPDR